MRISDWSSDVCSSDLFALDAILLLQGGGLAGVALQLGDARLGVLQGFLCGQQLVVGPAFQLVAFFIEQALVGRSEEHTSELQSLMRISYAVFCLKKKNIIKYTKT